MSSTTYCVEVGRGWKILLDFKLLIPFVLNDNFYCKNTFPFCSPYCLLKPSSHKRHKDKDMINTKTKLGISSRTCKNKTTIIFLCFAFCSVLGLYLDYNLMLMLKTILMSQTWLHSFDFCFNFMLMYKCEPGFKLPHVYPRRVRSREQFI